jgi:peptide/nickel transport system substrate-binding protein
MATGVLLFFTLVLPACALFGAAPKTSHRSGSIVVGMGTEVDALLPLQATSLETASVDRALWAPLWYGDPSGDLHPGLVRELPSLQNGDISPDLKTWTIRLRPHLKWSDGSPLTATDIAFSLNTYADVHFNCSCDFPRHDPSDPTDFLGATALDPTTVRFTLAHPNNFLLQILADGTAGPIPQEVFGAMPPARIATSHEGVFPTVVSGPFTMKEHVQGDHLTVVHNPHYYLGPDRPYLNQITFKFLPNENAVLTALQAGQIDTALRFDLADLDHYRALPGYTTYLEEPPVGYEMLAFNLTNPVLKDVAVRRALTLSLDPRQVMALLPPETVAPTCDDHDGTFAHESQLTCYPQDPILAGRLLDEAGWRLGPDGVRHKGDQTLALRYSTFNVGQNPYRLQIEGLAQAAWAGIGIKITIQNYPIHEFAGTVLPHATFDIAEFYQEPSYDPDDSWQFMCNQTPEQGGGNVMHYCSRAVDQAETLQLSTVDRAVRTAAFRSIDAAILADVPVMYLYSLRLIGVCRSTLHNCGSSAVYFGMWNLWDWYLG